jgi:hypothetical protein
MTKTIVLDLDPDDTDAWQATFRGRRRVVQASEAGWDPTEHPRDEEGKFASTGAAAPPKMRKSKHPQNEFGFTVSHGGKDYEVYFDPGSRSWSSLDLLNVSGPGGTPVDFIASNKAEMLQRIQSGELQAKIDRYTKRA